MYNHCKAFVPMRKPILFITTLVLAFNTLSAQHNDANVFGDVQSEGEHIPFATVYVEGTTIGTSTDQTGHYMLIDLPEGHHVLVAKAVGYKPSRREVEVVHHK